MAATITPVPELRPLRRPAPRPQLTLIEGGRSDRALGRTYRRRRLAALMVAVICAVVSLGAGRAAVHAVTPHAPTALASATPASATAEPSVVVEPGDTLWSIARRLQPTGDLRPLVDRLAALHGPAALQAGERVALPS